MAEDKTKAAAKAAKTDDKKADSKSDDGKS